MCSSAAITPGRRDTNTDESPQVKLNSEKQEDSGKTRVFFFLNLCFNQEGPIEIRTVSSKAILDKMQQNLRKLVP